MAKLHYASSKDPDMFYLVGKPITDPFFFFEAKGQKLVFLNALEIGAFNDQNERSGLQAIALDSIYANARKLEVTASPLQKIALTICREYAHDSEPIMVSKHLPLDIADFLRAQGVLLSIHDPFLPERRKKSSQEQNHIRKSVTQTVNAFDVIESILADSRITNDTLVYKGETLTSEFLKDHVQTFLFGRGFENPDSMIISCGAHAAMPHHGGSGPLRPHQTIVCDIFPRNRSNGYFADVSRTYVKGIASAKLQGMYDAVKNAQQKATEAVRPGAKASDIHRIASEIILKAGFDVGDKGFIHSLGHGVGLEVHEEPHVGPNSPDVLEDGDVITIEPGLYYPADGGIRLEDVVLVTSDGYENLTTPQTRFVIK